MNRRYEFWHTKGRHPHRYHAAVLSARLIIHKLMITVKCSLTPTLRILHDAIDGLTGEKDIVDRLSRSLQGIYNNFVTRLMHSDFGSHLSVHSYYSRKIRIMNYTASLLITRMKDTDDNRTHAVLLSFMIPYSPYLVHDYCDAARKRRHQSENLFDPSAASNMRYRLKKFKELFKVPDNYRDADKVTDHCFTEARRQLIHSGLTPNRLLALN